MDKRHQLQEAVKDFDEGNGKYSSDSVLKILSQLGVNGIYPGSVSKVLNSRFRSYESWIMRMPKTIPSILSNSSNIISLFKLNRNIKSGRPNLMSDQLLPVKLRLGAILCKHQLLLALLPKNNKNQSKKKQICPLSLGLKLQITQNLSNFQSKRFQKQKKESHFWNCK